MTDDLVTVPRLLLEDLQRRVAKLEAKVASQDESPADEQTEDPAHAAFIRFRASARRHDERRRAQ